MISLKDFFYRDVVDQKNRPEMIRFRLAQFFIMVLPFNILYSNIILYLLLVTTLLDLNRNKFKSIPRQIWIFQIVYFLALAGYFYSFNKSSAGFMLERQLTIVIFPLFLPLSFEITETRKRQILNTFTLSLVFTIIYLLTMAIITVKELGLPLKGIFSKEFFNHQFSAPIGIHAGYLSLYVALCILHIARLIMQRPSPILKTILISFIIVLTTGMFFLASRNMIIATFIIMSLVFPWFFVKKKFLFFSFLAAFLISSYFMIAHITYLNERFSSGLIADIKFNNGASYNYETVEPRIKRWQCASELIANSPFIGYGTGDEIPLLKTKYIEKGLYISYLESFNAHNQYISYTLKNGILGLVVFLLAFTYYVWLAIKNKSYIYLCFLLLLLIGFFTENILDANKGIFFFAFFNTLLGYTLLNRKNEKLTEDPE